MTLVARVCQPSILRMTICPDAISAQKSIAAVAAKGDIHVPVQSVLALHIPVFELIGLKINIIWIMFFRRPRATQQ